jgi:hypothetical protein
MAAHRLCTALVIASALAVATCGSSDDTSPTGSGGAIKRVVLEREDAEAAAMAIWLTGDRYAPEDLYRTINYDLGAIRDRFENDIPEVDIRFLPPWIVSEVIAGLWDSGIEKLRSGNWPEFTALNDSFHLTELDTTRMSAHSYVTLEFEGQQHPVVIGEAYQALDDVQYAEPNGWAGDYSNVYSRHLDGGGMSYLWRDGWGDCPAGCINNRFWYFRVTDGLIDYLGTFELGVDPEPHWWDEAKRAYYYYRGLPVDGRRAE